MSAISRSITASARDSKVIALPATMGSPPHVLRQMRKHIVAILVRLDDVLGLHAWILGGCDLLPPAASPGQAQAPQPVLADQQIEPQADPRLEENDRQPKPGR